MTVKSVNILHYVNIKKSGSLWRLQIWIFSFSLQIILMLIFCSVESSDSTQFSYLADVNLYLIATIVANEGLYYRY